MVSSNPHKAEELPGLDEAARSLIAGADTFFIASATNLEQRGGGVDVSHRGGRPASSGSTATC